MMRKEEEDKIISQAIVPKLDVPTVSEGEGIYGSIGESAFEDSRLKLMIDQDYIDGTIEDVVRGRFMSEGRFTVTNEEVEAAINKEYNRQVASAKNIFLSQGDDLIVTGKVTVDDDNIEEIINKAS